MLYQSTRNSHLKIQSAQAIANGISEDGGLFVPEKLPKLNFKDFKELAKCDYNERAVSVLSQFLTDFSHEEILESVKNAYGGEKFDADPPAILKKLYGNVHMLELWHGPTNAFKDMALQILPHLLTKAANKTAQGKKIVILVATSGDTGKAALEGFRDIKNTEIIVFYPRDGVSHMQKLQMITQQGANVHVCGIEGNFDDAQTGVKKIFTDPAIRKELEAKGLQFSSANSINWGRLVPQVVYYISAYCDLLKNGTLKEGEKFNIVVPTGNFGNILAAYYAKNMGVPVHKLICASNKNKILTDFIKTGEYNRNRAFFTTMSPSMDILISSNLERLLFDLCGKNSETLKEWMESLSKNGEYQVDDAVLSALQDCFYAEFCNEEQTGKTIKDTYQNHGYLCDTHTAVAVHVYEKYKKETGDLVPSVIVSTANPYKFPQNVLKSIALEKVQGDEFQIAKILYEITGVPIPSNLEDLQHLEYRHQKSCKIEEMQEVVYQELGI